jgi:negative regulator of flagellin synthesis FlgM
VANRINSLDTPAAGSGSVPVTRTGAASTAAPSAPAASANSDVHITDTATRLAVIEQTLRDSPAVDPLRVAHFRSAIESGQYTVRPEHVASQLLQFEHALGGLTRTAAAQPET